MGPAASMAIGTPGDVEQGGKPAVQFEESPTCWAFCRMPLGDGGMSVPCCCCLLPEVRATSAEGLDLGSSSRYFVGATPCVPKVLYSERGEPVYVLKPQTCCWGCCVAWNCCAPQHAFGNSYPYYFHDASSGAVCGGPYGSKDTPHIRKGCHSEAEPFAIVYPKNIDPQRRASLLGLACLLEFVALDRRQQKAC